MKNVYLFMIQSLMALSLVLSVGCSKDDPDNELIPGNNKPPTCSISNPQNNAQFSMDESITVTVVAEDTDGTIVEVQLYVDNVGHSLKTAFPYNFTINAGELSAGSHTLKTVAKDNDGAKSEATVAVTIKQPSTESPDFVSFSDGKIPNTWQTTAWTIDNTVGFDDIYSLNVSESGVAVVTSKKIEAYSYVEFYTTGDNFYFYIDGVRVYPIKFDNTGNWQQWTYAISPGTHTFKWETTSSTKLNLDAIKFAPSGLPEIYTVYVTQSDGYSVIVDYVLLSNGNNTTTHGVCWSTSPNPVVAGNKTTNTESIADSYMSLITNLNHNTTYYFRAYATNTVGTVYGEELTIMTSESFVGDFYQGGIVVWVDETGEHGLIAAPEDQNIGIQWYNGSYISTGATGTSIGTGQSNTTKIVQMQGSGSYAAKLCDDLILNGYDDWFLPSKDELNILYQNRVLIGGFAPDVYWSSSELNYLNAWYQPFNNGYQNYNYYKDITYRVRAVRAF